ncbi:MAG: hypothetical protein PHR45_04860 [Muribaculaceae bacterium]|nr:hypothetical protein [Muribaculaceae bacterium]
MEQEVLKKISKDTNGLLTYEYIANHIDGVSIEDLGKLVDNMILVDTTGQFVVSTARYLHAINADEFAILIDKLIKAAIKVDREHKYITDLLASIWGADYKLHVEELNVKDDNFRRIYKRVFSVGI